MIDCVGCVVICELRGRMLWDRDDGLLLPTKPHRHADAWVPYLKILKHGLSSSTFLAFPTTTTRTSPQLPWFTNHNIIPGRDNHQYLDMSTGGMKDFTLLQKKSFPTGVFVALCPTMDICAVLSNSKSSTSHVIDAFRTFSWCVQLIVYDSFYNVNIDTFLLCFSGRKTFRNRMLLEARWLHLHSLHQVRLV